MQKAGKDLWSDTNKVNYKMPQITNEKPGKFLLLSKENRYWPPDDQILASSRTDFKTAIITIVHEVRRDYCEMNRKIEIVRNKMKTIKKNQRETLQLNLHN